MSVRLPSPGVRCFASTARSTGVRWPDLRLWVRREPSGAAVGHERCPGFDAIAFDAYSDRYPGTREVRLGDTRFFAFSGPRLGAEHFVVWRRTADIHAAAERWIAQRQGSHDMCNLDPRSPLRLTTMREKPQLTAAVWQWDKQNDEGNGVKDPNRYWDDHIGDGPWMYWDSFWAPADAAAFASTVSAFGDVDGAMLAPLLNDKATYLADKHVHAQRACGPALVNQPEGSVVASTAIGRVPKDLAYGVVYDYNVWGSDVSRSGTGSDFWSPEARLAVTALEVVVDAFCIRSIVDCACGDATWMVPYFVRRHPQIGYAGVDIVQKVIDENRRRHPDLDFFALDAAESPLPVGLGELIFSKETINHMDLDDAMATIRRFMATGARFLLTNVHEGSLNEMGRQKGCFTTYIKYDYELPPFNLRKVARIIEYQGLQTSYSLFALNS